MVMILCGIDWSDEPVEISDVVDSMYLAKRQSKIDQLRLHISQ